MRILGIDPGSLATGYGLVERCDGQIHHLGHGVIRSPRGTPLPERLARLHRELTRLIERERPESAAVERVFVAADPRAALVLGQARGVILAALAEGRVEVTELAAREVKQAVTGSGAAAKSQVQAMVRQLLSLSADPPSDAADALAIALCCAQGGRLRALGVRAGARRRTRRRRTGVAQRVPS